MASDIRRHAFSLLALVAMLAACDGGGDEGVGGPDVTPPTTPTGLAVSVTSSTVLRVIWGAAADDRGVTLYRLQRDASLVRETTDRAYDDAGLSPATTYCYRVQAIDAAGNVSTPTPEACATTAAPPGAELTITRTGLGSVQSAPAGLDCGTDCAATFPPGSSVTLTAVAAAGSVLEAWGGCDTSVAGVCTVTMSGSRAVSVRFAPAPPPPVALTVERAGSGSGTVTSTPSGVSCGATCAAEFPQGTPVTLVAAAVAGSTFAGWQGCDLASGTSCAVTPLGARTVTATFQPTPPPTLTVARGGTGTGTVASSPAGISCGLACSSSFPTGTILTLAASPAAGSIFAAWSGCDSIAGSTCTVTLTRGRQVSALFAPVVAGGSTSTLIKSGSGTGAVAVGSLTCDAGCSRATVQIPSGASVTLTATAAPRSTFTGWTGCPRVAGSTCSFTAPPGRTITANFELTATLRTLTVLREGNGAGTVTSSPAGIDCGETCAASFDAGQVATLTAAPTGAATFGGWAGCDSASGTACKVTMNAARSVSARFDFDTTVRMALGNLPLTSGTGTYALTWSCISQSCTNVSTLQEDGDSSFASPEVFTLLGNVRTKAFTAKPDGRYCYRVRGGGDAGPWSEAKCITVAHQAPTLRLVNATKYDVISLTLNGQEQIPVLQAIAVGDSMDYAFQGPGTVTWRAAVGFYAATSRDEWFIYQATEAVSDGQITTVTLQNPSIEQVLANYGTSADWVGTYWLGLNGEYEARFRFTSAGAWSFFDRGALVASGSVRLLSWPERSFCLDFALEQGGEAVQLCYPFQNFVLENGPTGWKTIQYFRR